MAALLMLAEGAAFYTLFRALPPETASASGASPLAGCNRDQAGSAIGAQAANLALVSSAEIQDSAFARPSKSKPFLRVRGRWHAL
jgi:hypothetical protein